MWSGTRSTRMQQKHKHVRSFEDSDSVKINWTPSFLPSVGDGGHDVPSQVGFFKNLTWQALDRAMRRSLAHFTYCSCFWTSQITTVICQQLFGFRAILQTFLAVRLSSFRMTATFWTQSLRNSSSFATRACPILTETHLSTLDLH